MILLMSSLFFVGIPTEGYSVHAPAVNEVTNQKSKCTSNIFAPLEIADLAKMSRKQVERKIDRKLKFKERLTFRVMKRYAKKMDRLGTDEDACAMLEKKAKGGVLFGILGLIIAGLIFGILAIINGSKAKKLAKENPSCLESQKRGKQGTVAIVLGILDIIGGALVIALLL